MVLKRLTSNVTFVGVYRLHNYGRSLSWFWTMPSQVISHLSIR